MLPWTSALEVWKKNNSLKKKRSRRRGAATSKPKPNDSSEPEKPRAEPDVTQLKEEPGSACPEQEPGPEGDQDSDIQEAEAKPLKFRVTCNRAGDKHSFTSNDAARDFGGAVQEFFQWKADMTRFDVEVSLRAHPLYWRLCVGR